MLRLRSRGSGAVRSVVSRGADTRRCRQSQGDSGAGDGVFAFTVHHGPDDPVPDDRRPAGRNVGAARIPWRGSAAADLGQRNRHRPTEQLRHRSRARSPVSWPPGSCRSKPMTRRARAWWSGKTSTCCWADLLLSSTVCAGRECMRPGRLPGNANSELIRIGASRGSALVTGP